MYRQLSSSPSSSVNVTPSSSPVFGPVDSSPPSSPGLVPYTLDSPPRPTISLPFSHPFAASTKAIKRLPNYEKKANSPPCTPPGMFTRSTGLERVASRSLQEEDYINSGSPKASSPSHRTLRYIDPEECLWDDALRKPFDTGIGQIDLSNREIKSIPPSVGDLAGFFNTPELSEQHLFSGRTFVRINTEPPIDSRARSFERAQSIKDSGKERHVLKLYLMGNKISSLPPELFTIRNLTVLSLRANRLTFIPPDICHFTNLHELNLSNNFLQFLPWEMRDMKIDKLLVHPNPFLPEPTPATPRRRSLTRLRAPPPAKPVLSPVTYTLAPVPPLTELCLRLLLAPSIHAHAQTVLGEYYGPLSDQWSLPPNVRHVLSHVVPDLVMRPRKRVTTDETYEVGTTRCPDPTHRGRVCVRYASERYSWERRIAGVDVGGAVPLRWRGCLQTCLDFLDEGEDEAEADRQGPVEDKDVDVAMAVQAVDLGSVRLDLDEFDD